MRHALILVAIALTAVACESRPVPTAPELVRSQVEQIERAFARSMAERDHAAFVSFLSDDAVFFTADSVLRGRQAVADGWKPLFDGAAAPFAWEPEVVEVLDGGSLALSSGPVLAPDGTQLGSFTSIWREEEPGVWRVVFDKGCE